MRHFFAGSAAGTRLMPKLVTSPPTANPTRITPAHICDPVKNSNSQPPPIVPTTMARKVPSSSRPLPQDSRFSGSNSGSRPYLDGPKNALCVPIRKTPANKIGACCHANPAVASSMMNTSSTLTPMVMVRLLKRSAR